MVPSQMAGMPIPLGGGPEWIGDFLERLRTVASDFRALGSGFRAEVGHIQMAGDDCGAGEAALPVPGADFWLIGSDLRAAEAISGAGPR